MRRILGLALLAVAGWAGWWWVAAGLDVRQTEAWLDARRADGWQTEWADIRVDGAPLRYTRRIEAPMIADPATGWAWRAPFVEISRPRHPQIPGVGTVLRLPQTQELQTPYERVAIAAEIAEAQADLQGRRNRVIAAEITLSGLRFVSDLGWEAALAEGHVRAVATQEAPETLVLEADLRGFAPPPGLLQVIGDGDRGSAEMERATLDAVVRFDRPWDIRALEERRPQPERIEVDEAAVQWGQLELRVAGTLDLDADGRPTGELVVKATNWREILAAAQASGAMPEGLAGAIERGLELLSRLAGSTQTLDIPLGFDGQRTRLGPVPIGSAPVIRLP